jgi:hypothetical protein
MDLVQEPVRRLGQMSTRICSTCRKYLHSVDYHPREWKKREKRTCTECRKKEQTIAAAPGIPSSSPEGQHGALSTHTPTPFDQLGGGQSAASTGDVASAGVGGDFVAASPPSPVLGTFVFRNLARPVGLSNTSPALGGGRAPPQDTLRAVAAGRLPTVAGQPTPGGGGAKSTCKASVPSFMVSTFSRSVCAVSVVNLACCRADDTFSVRAVIQNTLYYTRE